MPLGSALTSRTQTRLNAFTTGVTSIEVTRARSAPRIRGFGGRRLRASFPAAREGADDSADSAIFCPNAGFRAANQQRSNRGAVCGRHPGGTLGRPVSCEMAARGTSRVSRIFAIWPRLRVRRKVPGLRVRRDFSRSLPGPLFGALAILAVFGRPCGAPRDPDRPLAECSSSPCDNGAECYDSLDAPLAYRHINFQPPGTETPDGYLDPWCNA